MPSSTDYVLQLPKDWVTAKVLERALCKAGEAHHSDVKAATFVVPQSCKIMVDAGTQLLSLANQLAGRGVEVVIKFEEGMDGVMGYLSRIGFFELLNPSICTEPIAPEVSGAHLFRGGNPTLVEISRIERSKNISWREIPTRLADALESACQERHDCERLVTAASTVFGELIGNIFEHSETEIDGYAALQMYRSGGRVLVSVSDSGHGLLQTLRPTLATALNQLSDAELVVHMLNHGISRHGAERGCGLKICALQSLKFQASLMLRLPDSSIELAPSDQGYQLTAQLTKGLPYLKGTHIAFSFRLNSPTPSPVI